MTENCVMTECSNVSSTRGLCDQHYGAARELVKSGLTTWDELESMGKARAGRRGGGVGNGKYQTQFFSSEELQKRAKEKGLTPPKPPPISPNQASAL